MNFAKVFFWVFFVGSNLARVAVGQDLVLSGMSREDSLFFSKYNAELVWGHDRESADFFAQHSNGDYFILNLKTQKVIVQSQDLSRKQNFAISGNDFGLWNTIEQPFFEENSQMCLVSFGCQYYFSFRAEENKWEVLKVPLNELVKGFREVKIHRFKDKNLYAAGWGSSTAMRPNGVFAQIGEIDFDAKKIAPLLSFKIKKDPARYVGYKKFQAHTTKEGLLLWVQFEKNIYFTDENFVVSDTISVSNLHHDVDLNQCVLLRDEGDNGLYFWAKSKSENKAYWFEIVEKNKKIKISEAKILPAMYPVYLRNKKLFLAANTNKGGKLTVGNDDTRLAIYALDIGEE
jgi:hypothetical protein